MDANKILQELTYAEGLPKTALRAAAEHRAELTPLFLDEIEKYLAASSEDRDDPNAIFFIFFLLAEWREKSAYRPLARLLRCPRDDIEALLGDGVTESAHRVMAAVFDGDPQPLFDIVLDPNANEWVRSNICETLAMLVALGELPREPVAAFLRELFDKLPREEECAAWWGWLDSVAALALEEMRPLVKEAFEREFIHPSWTSYDYFEKDIAHAIANPAQPFASGSGKNTLWGNTVEELSKWYGFSEQRKKDEEERRRREAQEPKFLAKGDDSYRNPYKDVGRNDPCPCGSGKKYKKCCLR